MDRRRKKTGTVVFGFALLAFLATPCQAAPVKKLTIGWVYAMANAPLIVAQQKGYFRDQGLEIEALSYTSGPLVHQALLAGELDLAYIGAAPVYQWYSRGLQSRILAKVNYGQAAVVAGPESGVTALGDLKGRRIAGVRKGSGMDVLLRGYVLEESGGLSPDKDVQILPMAVVNMESALVQKLVDAAFMWEPFTSEAVLRGHGRVVFDMNRAVPRYPWYVIMAVPRTLAERREDVLRVLRAHRQAVDFLNSAPDAGNDIIARAFRLTEVVDPRGTRHSPGAVVAEARTRLGWEWNFTGADRQFLQRLVDYSQRLGYTRKGLRVDDILDNSLIREAATDGAAGPGDRHAGGAGPAHGDAIAAR